jgi:hypothetical protein
MKDSVVLSDCNNEACNEAVGRGPAREVSIEIATRRAGDRSRARFTTSGTAISPPSQLAGSGRERSPVRVG